MLSQTITPPSDRITVEIPRVFMNQPVEIVLIPKQFWTDVETRRKQVDVFFEPFRHQQTFQLSPTRVLCSYAN